MEKFIRSFFSTRITKDGTNNAERTDTSIYSVSRNLTNVSSSKKIRVCPPCGNSYEIRVAIRELYCKKFLSNRQKNLKRRNLWELLHFQVLNLK
ncbi:hypothetical protein LEP1GSC171_3407 [Leptospira santarosai str. HAI1380]|nr:hypothetical protein LEP1GSC168_2132 [Leptospira santarosai str. HAI134]EMP01242.1 hypothetical protein LEP1GSC171_3407 [Leptospira santarosai str. HAI1380]